jgi:hypothetical protein
MNVFGGARRAGSVVLPLIRGGAARRPPGPPPNATSAIGGALPSGTAAGEAVGLEPQPPPAGGLGLEYRMEMGPFVGGGRVIR